MLQALKDKTQTSEKNDSFKSFFFLYVISPVKSGLAGFAAFFSILMITKALGYLLGTQPTFNIIFDDVLLSSIGFVLVFLIRFLENLKDKEN